MEGGQKQEINLTAGLDVKSSDMLTSISEPTFEHNRQQYQGKYLPSSVRFEHDGWAVGWDVYNFDVQNDDVQTEPEGFYVVKKRLNNNPAYVLIFQKPVDLKTRQDYVQLFWNVMSSASGEQIVSNDGLVSHYTGILNDKTYTVNIDRLNGTDSVDMESGAHFSHTVTYFDDGTGHAVVLDLDTQVKFLLRFEEAGSFYNEGVEFAKYVSFDGHTHRWISGADVVTFDGEHLLLNDEEIPFTTSGRHISSSSDKETLLDVMATSVTDNWVPVMRNIYAEPNNPNEGWILPNSMTAEGTGARALCTFGAGVANGSSRKQNQKFTVSGYIPVYFGISLTPVDKDGVRILELNQWLINRCVPVEGVEGLSCNAEHTEYTYEYKRTYTWEVPPYNTGGHDTDVRYDASATITYRDRAWIDADGNLAVSSTITDSRYWVEDWSGWTISDLRDAYPPSSFSHEAFPISTFMPNTSGMTDIWWRQVTTANGGKAYMRAVRGNFSKSYWFKDKLSDLNYSDPDDPHLLSELGPAGNGLYIDRGEYNLVNIKNVGTLTYGQWTMRIEPVEGFYVYTTKVQDPDHWYAQYCPPTIYYNSLDYAALESPSMTLCGTEGERSVTFRLKYTPTVLKEITTITSAVNKHIAAQADNDRFLVDTFPVWRDSMNVEFTEVDSRYLQTVKIYMHGALIADLVYDSATGEYTTISLPDGVLDGYAYDADDGSFAGSSYSIKFGVTVSYTLDIEADLPATSHGTIRSYADNVYSLTYGDIPFYVNPVDKTVRIRRDVFDVEKVDGVCIADVDSSENVEFQFVAVGPFGNGVAPVAYDGSVLTVVIDGTEYHVDVAVLISKKDVMKFLYTDVRDEELKQTEIASVDIAEEYQFIRQQWDTTTETEGFWWVDPLHVLCLKQDRWVLRRKTDRLDDWNGDVFEDIASWTRDVVLDAGVASFGVSSAYNGDTALLYTVSVLSEYAITVKFYDPHNMQSSSVILPIVRHDLGDRLNQSVSVLNTYSNLNSTAICESKFSCTCRDGRILFGIHYNKNFNQWAVNIDRETMQFTVLHGYGFVGVNGCLTGGEIPTECFSETYGFDGTVRDLDILKSDEKFCNSLDELYAIDVGEGVVGTDSQQWYLYKQLTGIVSHLTWNSERKTWERQVLPITNKLSQRYASGSFSSYLLSDYLLSLRPFYDIFPASTGDPMFNVVTNMMRALFVFAGEPVIYMLFPKIGLFMELQQTFGQAAYVHRNLSEVRQQKDITKGSDLQNTNDMGDYWKEGDYKGYDKLASELPPFMKDEVTFNTHIVKQSTRVDDYYSLLLTQLLPAFLSGGMSMETSEVKVEAHRNKTDTGTQTVTRTTTYTKNVDLSASSENVLKGVCNCVNSAVAGALSLDMFFTTADAQEISAGPGWVNHNFVAQCVSSSVTAHHMEFNQNGILFVIKKLTLLQIQLEHMAVEKAVYLLVEGAELVKGLTVYGAINVGAAIAAGMLASAEALRAEMKLLEVTENVMDSLLDAMGGDRMRSVCTMQKSTHTVDPEGKHNYGDKTECFMWPCYDTGVQSIPDETVDVVAVDTPWEANVPVTEFLGAKIIVPIGLPSTEGLVTANNGDVIRTFNGPVHYFVANTQGSVRYRNLPKGTAYVLGVESFLQKTPFRNENIGESEPVFTTQPFQDYIIDERWQLAHNASVDMSIWTSCKDTKLIDGELSNVVVSDDFCGISSSYTAIEVKRGIDKRYLRPVAITPNALGLNISGKNCCYNRKAYHAFDGYGYRIVRWMGAAGMNKERQTWLYSFLVNDRFKRSNKLPLNEYLGNFNTDPINAVSGDENDHLYTLVTQPNDKIGIEAGTIGEDKSAHRYAIPVFTEHVQSLPAVVKTVSSIQLVVMDGVTSLTTDNRDLQSAYKAPVSVDFAIGKTIYRYTTEYICLLEQKQGITVTQEQVPCLGLTFLGSTQSEAYLYSQATRQYYSFSGGTSLNVIDMVERFRNIKNGFYDFVNQEVLMPCLATFNRLDARVYDDSDETDNVIVPRLKGGNFKGELAPPLDTIYNTRSWFKVLSLPCGLTYQGPNRCIINRFVVQDHMIKQIKDNYGKWKRIDRETYHPFRGYKAKYEWVDEQIGDKLEVKGWTHNPFLLVTAPLGVNEHTDCIFEWEITFCWPVEMDKLYDADNYATVCIQAETMTPGGKVIAQRPVHVYLTKELFTRTGCYGYYSFRYQSDCGSGNRERLHIWSDQYICVSSLQCEYKTLTQKRTEILTQQVDVYGLKEI